MLGGTHDDYASRSKQEMIYPRSSAWSRSSALKGIYRENQRAAAKVPLQMMTNYTSRRRLERRRTVARPISRNCRTGCQNRSSRSMDFRKRSSRSSIRNSNLGVSDSVSTRYGTSECLDHSVLPFPFRMHQLGRMILLGEYPPAVAHLRKFGALVLLLVSLLAPTMACAVADAPSGAAPRS